MVGSERNTHTPETVQNSEACIEKNVLVSIKYEKGTAVSIKKIQLKQNNPRNFDIFF